MDRLTFLRSMLGNTALLTLPPFALLSPSDQDRLSWTEDCHGIFVFDTYVRGFTHYSGPASLPKIATADPLLVPLIPFGHRKQSKYAPQFFRRTIHSEK